MATFIACDHHTTDTFGASAVTHSRLKAADLLVFSILLDRAMHSSYSRPGYHTHSRHLDVDRRNGWNHDSRH
jgi:hypothetical protein